MIDIKLSKQYKQLQETDVYKRKVNFKQLRFQTEKKVSFKQK